MSKSKNFKVRKIKFFQKLNKTLPSSRVGSSRYNLALWSSIFEYLQFGREGSSCVPRGTIDFINNLMNIDKEQKHLGAIRFEEAEKTIEVVLGKE